MDIEEYEEYIQKIKDKICFECLIQAICPRVFIMFGAEDGEAGEAFIVIDNECEKFRKEYNSNKLNDGDNFYMPTWEEDIE